MCIPREKMDIYEPRREALEETIPVATLILDFWNLELQGNVFGPLSYQVFGTWLGYPGNWGNWHSLSSSLLLISQCALQQALRLLIIITKVCYQFQHLNDCVYHTLINLHTNLRMPVLDILISPIIFY